MLEFFVIDQGENTLFEMFQFVIVKLLFEDGLVTTGIEIKEAIKEEIEEATPTPIETETPEPETTVIVTPEPEPSPTPVPAEPSVKTGDTGNLWLWTILAIISVVILGGAAVEKHAKRQRG